MVTLVLGLMIAGAAFAAGYCWRRRGPTPSGAGHDEEARRRVESALRASEERFRLMVETSPDSVMLVQIKTDRPCLEWPIVMCNQRTAAMHGYAQASDMIGLTIQDLKAPHLLDPAADTDWLERLRRQGTLAGETTHRRRNGTTFELEYRTSLLVIDGQEYYLGIDRDITVRKAHESAQRASEERFRRLVETCPDSVMLVRIIQGQDWPIVQCNQRTAEMHGYERSEQMLGLTIRDIGYDVPTRGNPLDENDWLNRLRREGVMAGFTKHRRRDGTPFDLEYRVSRLFIDGQEHYLAIDRDISERKRAEEALRASEERFRRVIETCPDSVMLVKIVGQSMDWPIVMCNRRLLEMHGYDQLEDVIGMPNWKLSQQDETNLERRGLWLAHLREQGTLAGEMQHRRRDGSVFDVEYRTRLLTIDGQEYLLAIDRDISERKRAEEALRVSEERFRRMIETCPDSVMLVKIREGERDWPIVMCNQRMVEMHGYTSPDEVIGQPNWKLNYREDRQPYRDDSWLRHLRAQGTLAGEMRHERRDGTPFYIEYRARVVVLEGQEYLLAIDRDITERKRADAALQASDDFNRLVVEASNDGIMDVDLITGRVQASARLCEMLGRTPDRGFTTLTEFLELVHPEDRAAMEEERERHWREGTPLWYQGRYRHGDGGWRWLVKRATTRKDATGRPVRMVLSFSDVTEQRRADEELLQSRKLRAVGEMAGGIAHEFNNLLTPMLLQLDLITGQRTADAELASMLQPITRAAREARELTQRILAFGRRDVLARTRLDLNAVVADNLELLRHTVDRRITVRQESAPTPTWVEQNRSNLNQVIMNLVLNARDAVLQTVAERTEQAGPPSITVAVSLVERRSPLPAETPEILPWRCLTVTDNGCGISPENCERIFEPFFTTKGVGLGTGLGLATVWHLVSTMGGWIEVKSTLGTGTRMMVYLPEPSPTETTTTPAPVAPPPPPQSPPRAPARRVLLVEDNDQVAPVLKRLLERSGHSVTWCREGDAAWSALSAAAPAFDVLVTDINLPGKTGLQLIGLIRERGLPLRSVVIGGYLSEELRAELEALRVDAVLPKPFELADFNAAMAKAGA